MPVKCRSCGQPVEWVQTIHGKWIPVDRQPVDGGNLKIDRSTKPPGASVIRHANQPCLSPEGETLRFVSHFATCDHASQCRRT
jgi:hypothetical protein